MKYSSEELDILYLAECKRLILLKERIWRKAHENLDNLKKITIDTIGCEFWEDMWSEFYYKNPIRYNYYNSETEDFFNFAYTEIFRRFPDLREIIYKEFVIKLMK